MTVEDDKNRAAKVSQINDSVRAQALQAIETWKESKRKQFQTEMKPKSVGKK